MWIQNPGWKKIPPLYRYAFLAAIIAKTAQSFESSIKIERFIHMKR